MERKFTVSEPTADAAAGKPANDQRAEKKPERRKPGAGKEIGGRGGLDPTRYGDWEKNGRCIDF